MKGVSKLSLLWYWTFLALGASFLGQMGSRSENSEKDDGVLFVEASTSLLVAILDFFLVVWMEQHVVSSLLAPLQIPGCINHL